MSEHAPNGYNAILAPFARERTWLLPALQAVQAHRGWLALDDLAAVAAHLRVPQSEVYGVATHYPELRLAPRGRHLVRVCTGVPCRVNGGLTLLAALARRLGVEAGGTTTDGMVTLEEADCCFVCSVAPVVEVDHAYLSGPSVEAVVAACEGDAPAGAPGHGEATGEPSLAREPLDEAPATPDRPRASGAPATGRPVTPAGAAATAPTSRAAAGPAPATDAAGAAPASRAPTGPASAAGAAGTGRATAPSAALAAEAGSASAYLAALVAEARAAVRPGVRLLVGAGSCGLAHGAGATVAALPAALAAAGIAATVERGACNGLCYAAPVIELLRPDAPRLTVERVTPERLPALVRLLQGARDHGLDGAAWAGAETAGLRPVAAHPVLGGQQRLLAERWGWCTPAALGDALLAGTYAALARTLDQADPAAVIAAVKAAGLQGRGGAYFPTAIKWEGCRKAAGALKYVVVNGEEGEPGIFKDRHVMEGDPHGLLEGVLLAAYAAGASRGILYIHGEATLSAERCAAAVGQARARGLLGSRVLGTDFAFDMEIRRGAGGFVLGEETALLESIEGRRAMPRTKPPFPVDVGVYGKPTVINNVETLAAVPRIVGGRPEAAATKLFGLSGHVARPSVVELGPPVTLRRLVMELGGGLATGRPLGGVVIGGPSGIVVSPVLLDTPLERPALSPGTGGITALDDSVSVGEVVRTLLAFNAKESCGKCTPCREGTARLLALLDGPGGTGPGPDAAALRELADVIQLGSLCGLGQAAPLAFRAALEHFPG